MQDYSGYGGSGYGGGPTAPLPPPPPPRRRAGLLSYAGVAVAAGALGAGAVVALYHPASNSSSASPAPSISAPAATPSQATPAPSSGDSGGTASEQKVYDKVLPGLVLIDTNLQYSSEDAAGTGMIINSDGLVLTNNHVIEDSTKIQATVVSTGKTYTAKIVGYDTTGDVAVIKLQNASGLHTVPLGNSSSVKSGASVLAMGNAEGESRIVPAPGTITGIGKTITASDEGGEITSETLHGMFETNASVVSGDSGGPLANSSGNVIGMDTAGNDVSSQGGGDQSAAGFAIPIDTALKVAKQIESGTATSAVSIGYPPFIGIYISQSTSSSPTAQAQAEENQGSGGSGGGFGNGGYGNGYGGFGNGNGDSGGSSGSQSCYTSDADLTVPSTIASVSSGALDVGTICDSPAAKAGISSGSVITAVNGQSVTTPQSLTKIVSKSHPGDTISVTWVSPSGSRSTSSITLTQGPPL